MIANLFSVLPPTKRRRFQAFLVLSAVQAVLQGVGFALLAPFFSALLAGDQAATWRWAAVITAMVVVHHMLMWVTTSLAYSIGSTLLLEIQRQVADHVARLPIGWFSAERTGPLGRLLTTEVTDVASYPAHMLRPLVIGLITPPTIVVCLLVIDWRVAAVLFGGTLLAVAAWLLQLRIIRTNEAGFHDGITDAAGRIVEFARDQPVLRAFGAGRDLADADGSRLAAALDARTRGQRNLTMRGAVGLVLFVGALQVALAATAATAVGLYLGDELPLAALITILILALRLTEPIQMLANVGGMLQMAAAGLQRIRVILDTPTLPEPAEPATVGDHCVEFTDVVFRYPGSNRPVVNGVSFTAPARAVTAIVGPSGSGKTTLLRLVARFFDVDGGAVRIGGAAVRDLGTAATSSLITPVFQDVYLFEGTIAENLRMAAPDCDDAALDRAARIARVDEIVDRLPDGWETRIGEGGSTLSGGEKQRISIARALLKNAPIVLFDEATAALDPLNEAAVADAMHALAAERTVLVVAHRLPTVAAADRIVVLEEGRVVEMGTHAELHAAAGRYRDFWDERERAAGWRLA